MQELTEHWRVSIANDALDELVQANTYAYSLIGVWDPGLCGRRWM